MLQFVVYRSESLTNSDIHKAEGATKSSLCLAITNISGSALFRKACK